MDRRKFIKRMFQSTGALALAPLAKYLPTQQPKWYMGVDVASNGGSCAVLTLANIKETVNRIKEFEIQDEVIYLHPDELKRYFELINNNKIRILKPRSVGLSTAFFCSSHVPLRHVFKGSGTYPVHMRYDVKKEVRYVESI